MDDKKLVSGESSITGRQRVGPDHRPVDDQRQPGQTEQPREPAGAAAHATKDRVLDPYNPHEPGEDSPQGSPARPKAPPVHQADEAGNLLDTSKTD
ncbi:hypothetical protein [Lutibaculum baratangense]|uniref:Uncharacterized protein n=1 Tax=Lutibaculum baratangense AMV1 TaxID=631454 RepID=V4R4S2_9HYPH|nr:hypothetical protein [Lutibaculum baratangense]ESR26927.1 hypothetical protein N177_0711 [Lutibaculum baratangense AMV1]